MMPLKKLSTYIDLRKEIQEVYLHRLLFSLAEGLVAIFIPFYIIQQGFGITNVLIFFLIYYLTHLILPVPFGFISSKIGYKHTSLIASIPILLFYITIRSAETSLMLYTSAFLGGLGFIMYWMGMNPETALSSDEGNEESEVGFFFSLPSLAAILAPATGGTILYFSSFSLLFVAAAVIMLLSFAPFLLSSEHSKGMQTDIGDVFNGEMIFDFLAFYFKGFIYFVERVLWPLFLAIVIESSLDIGMAGTVFALGTATLSIILGQKMQPTNKKKILYASAAVIITIIIAMSFVTTPTTAFLIAGLFGLAFTGISMPVYSSAIKRAQRTDIIEYFAFREIGLSLGRITALALTYIIIIMLDQEFAIAFTILATATILFSLTAEKILE